MTDKPLTSQLEDIKADICDNYCKWPHIYSERQVWFQKYEDSFDALCNEKCANCPLNKL